MMLQTTSKLKSISIKEKEEVSSDEASTIIRRNSKYFSIFSSNRLKNQDFCKFRKNLLFFKLSFLKIELVLRLY